MDHKKTQQSESDDDEVEDTHHDHADPRKSQARTGVSAEVYGEFNKKEVIHLIDVVGFPSPRYPKE